MQAAFVVEFGQPIPSFTTNTKAVITNRPTNKCCLLSPPSLPPHQNPALGAPCWQPA